MTTMTVAEFKARIMWPDPRPPRVPLIDRLVHQCGIHTYRVLLGGRLYGCSVCTQTRNVT